MWFILLLCFGQSTPLPIYQDSDWSGKEIVVAVKHFRPMMITHPPNQMPADNFDKISISDPTGFDVDWAESLLKHLREHENLLSDTSIRWLSYSTVDGMLSAVKSGKAQFAISGITITPEREKIVDFSHQYKRSGMLLAVPNKRETSLPLVDIILDREIWYSLLILFVLYVVMGFAFFLVERTNKDRTVRTIRDAVSLAHETASTIGHGAIYPTTWPGLILSIMAFFTGVIVVGNVVSTMSSIRTVDKLDSVIQGPEDLQGKRVATVAGTNSVDVLRKYGAKVIECTDVWSCFRLLDKEEVDAVSHDAPAIRNYVNNPTDPIHRDKFATIGGLFDVCYYGIVLQQGSEWVEHFNRGILALQSRTGEGSYQSIQDKWFGK